MPGAGVRLFVCGDVMTGRGVDQILPHPGDSRLWEPYVTDARTYVRLAEEANGAIAAPVDYAWPWGDALRVWEQWAPDARVINLETAVTRSGDVARGKPVCYRMNPANIGCLTAAAPDIAVLANNHVLDFGYRGMEETLQTLDLAGIAAAGAGGDLMAARRPASVAVKGGARVWVWSVATGSSGVPAAWAATADRPGVDRLPDLSAATAESIVERVSRVKAPADVAVVSVHWGSNWGYEVGDDQIRFAHRLIDGGVDVVHGHSSHHPRPVEVYKGRLVLYGCGDFVNDYEGISGHDAFRDDLRLMYFVDLADTGALAALTMVPMQSRRMSLRHATRPDARWLATTLDRVSRPLRTSVRLDGDVLVCDR